MKRAICAVVVIVLVCLVTVFIVASAYADSQTWLDICTNYLVIAKGFGCDVESDFQYEYDDGVLVHISVDDMTMLLNKETSNITSIYIILYDAILGKVIDNGNRVAALLAACDYGRVKVGAPYEYRELKKTYSDILYLKMQELFQDKEPFKDSNYWEMYLAEDYGYWFVNAETGIYVVIMPMK